jgi:hypothetical protein
MNGVSDMKVPDFGSNVAGRALTLIPELLP